MSELHRTVQRFADTAAPDLSTAVQRAASEQRKARLYDEAYVEHRRVLDALSDDEVGARGEHLGIREASADATRHWIAKTLATAAVTLACADDGDEGDSMEWGRR